MLIRACVFTLFLTVASVTSVLGQTVPHVPFDRGKQPNDATLGPAPNGYYDNPSDNTVTHPRPPGLLTAITNFEVRTGLQIATNAAGAPVVAHIQSQSDGARSGVRTGDIITRIDGQPVSGLAEFHKYLLAHPMQAAFFVTFRRPNVPDFEIPVGRKLLVMGMVVFPDQADRPVVRQVLPHTAAASAGIKPGDMIVTVGGRDSDTMQKFITASQPYLGNIAAGEEFPFEVVRNGAAIPVGSSSTTAPGTTPPAQAIDTARRAFGTPADTRPPHSLVIPPPAARALEKFDIDEGFLHELSGMRPARPPRPRPVPRTNIQGSTGSPLRGLAAVSLASLLPGLGLTSFVEADGSLPLVPAAQTVAQIAPENAASGLTNGTGIPATYDQQQINPHVIPPGISPVLGVGDLSNLQPLSAANDGAVVAVLHRNFASLQQQQMREEMPAPAGTVNEIARINRHRAVIGFVMVRQAINANVPPPAAPTPRQLKEAGAPALLSARVVGMKPGVYVLTVNQFGDCGDVANGSTGPIQGFLGRISVEPNGRGLLQNAPINVNVQNLMGRCICLLPMEAGLANAEAPALTNPIPAIEACGVFGLGNPNRPVLGPPVNPIPSNAPTGAPPPPRPVAIPETP